MNLIIYLESGEGESNARPIDLQSIALPSELSPVKTGLFLIYLNF